MANRSMKNPHVIVCLCDQLRAFEVGCYGNKVIRTPHIDRLAEQGVRFEVACANNPVCTPSRSSLLSGQYSRTCTGVLGNVAGTPPSRKRIRLTDPVLPEAFKSAGYQTAVIGKWHIHPDPGIVGFDYTLCPHYNHRYTGQTYFENSGEGFIVEGFTPEYEIEQVRGYIRKHRDKPFFLFYNISPPHMPLADAPEKYTKMYSREQVPLRENVWIKEQVAHDEHWFKIYLWDYLFYKKHLSHTEELPAGFDLRNLTALYYGLTSWVDDLVGKLMQILEENNIVGETLLLFTSDHGDNLGSHHYFNKERLLEESIRIPMIYHWPGQVEAARCQRAQVASIVDVMPTLLGLVGLRIPETVQGIDLSPVLRGETETIGENLVFIETSMGGIGVRTLTHLYGIMMADEERESAVHQVSNGRYMFYDLREDPFEFNNLVQTEEQIDLAKGLRERVICWNRETPWKIIRE